MSTNKAGKSNEPITLEIRSGRKIRRMEFASEEDRIGWEKAYRKSKLYIPYFLAGIGINFLLFFAGLDLSKNLFMGALAGLAIPLASMYIFAELHYRLFMEKKDQAQNVQGGDDDLVKS